MLSVRAVRREWRYGDRVRFWIRPSIPQDSGNPGGFNYATYLAQRDIYVTGFLDSDEEVELLAREPGAARDLIERLRRRNPPFHRSQFFANQRRVAQGAGRSATWAASAKRCAPLLPPRGSIMCCRFPACMSPCSVWWSSRLIRHIGFAAAPFYCSAAILLKLATFGSFVAVVFYTALAGAMVPTVRSAIMIGVYELAVLLDREEEVFASLTLAALLIALVWPGVIADISFQLSFLAVLFIVWGMRKIHEWFPIKKSDELPQEKSWLGAPATRRHCTSRCRLWRPSARGR